MMRFDFPIVTSHAVPFGLDEMVLALQVVRLNAFLKPLNSTWWVSQCFHTYAARVFGCHRMGISPSSFQK
jgi:hypothetical protein